MNKRGYQTLTPWVPKESELSPGLVESHKLEVERWKAIRAEKIAASIRAAKEAELRRERLGLTLKECR